MIRLSLLLCFTLVSFACARVDKTEQEIGPWDGAARVVLLGTGTEDAHPDRSGPCVALITGEQTLLVDAGPGLVRRAAEGLRAGESGLAVQRLDRVFLTSLAQEHTAGLSDLILTPWAMGRKTPLTVFGPRGTTKLVDRLLEAYADAIHARAGAPEGSRKKAEGAQVHEIEAGALLEMEGITVRAFETSPGPSGTRLGYRFETMGRVIVVSGSTGPSPQLVKAARDCDVLVHEVYCRAGFVRRSPPVMEYVAKYHTSSKQLAELAEEARPKLVVLYEQRMYGATEADLLGEIAQGYKGRVVFGNDLDRF